MKRIAAALLCLLTLAACDDGPKCAQGHYNYVPIMQQRCVSNGKTTTCTPYTTIMPVWYCDVYETPATKEAK
jgi:hypothetical protein